MRRVLPFGVCLIVACSGGSSDSTPNGDDASNADSIASGDDTTPADDSASSSDTTGSTDSTTTETSDDVALGDYPSGPYGNAVGDTFPDLAWQGYVDDAADAVATSKAFGAYSSDAIRRSGKRYAFVHVSDYY